MTAAQKTDLKEEFHASLIAGASSELLTEIVERFKDGGGSQVEAYESIQDIWLEYGFDEDEEQEPNSLRDRLEFVLELIWGFGPGGRGIWETPLTDEMFEK